MKNILLIIKLQQMYFAVCQLNSFKKKNLEHFYEIYRNISFIENIKSEKKKLLRLLKLEVCRNCFLKQTYLITPEHLKLFHTQVIYQKIMTIKWKLI